MAKYEHADNDEEIEIEKDGVLSFACCDCALVHEMRFKIEGDKLVVMFKRNNRKTGALRRYHGIPMDGKHG